MKKACLVVLFLLSANLVFAEVSIIMKNGNVLTWHSYFEEGSSYCTWKSAGKFCVPQNDVKVIKETGEASGQGSSNRSYGNSGQDSSSRTYRDSGPTSTIIQRRGSAVIIDEGLSKDERDAEALRLESDREYERRERERKYEKEKEEARDREDQRIKEAEERRYQEERDRRTREEERRLYRGMGNDRY